MRECGAALLTILILLVLVSCGIIVDRLAQTLPARHERDAVTARSLSEAKSALIAWAVTLSPSAGTNVVPGLLPFPDRNRDGNYDGKGDCVTFGLNDSHLLGRFPWSGDATPCPRIPLNINVRDGAKEHLWYAVSRNLLTRGRGTPVNPDIGNPLKAVYPWVRIRGARGQLVTDLVTGQAQAIAAVIIAPGAALEDQDRSGRAPGSAEYLDSVQIDGVTFDNADADGCPDDEAPPCGWPTSGEEFVKYENVPADTEFNDHLTYITVAELMRVVEKRVLGEVALALARYRDTYGTYPWLAEYRNPKDRTSFNSAFSRDGQLPVHLRDEVFGTRLRGSWTFNDSTPSTVTRHSGHAGLVPPLADAMSGSIHVEPDSGRCVWSDGTGGNCTGTRKIPAYYRTDLHTVVTRTIEISFNIVDHSPQVHPPTSGDVRRRSLVSSTLTRPISSAVSWSVRITDYDGVNMGQRELVIDADTSGEIELGGIRYDMSVVYDGNEDERDELPEWFIENNWHHFVYVALSADAAPGGDADGDGDCATPVNTCLTLKVSGKSARSDVRALLVSSGGRLPGQDRSIGDCDGDGVGDDSLCAYFEGDNSDKSTPAAADTYARDPFSARFNDQVRVVEPLPP